jgi:hypothetical protein
MTDDRDWSWLARATRAEEPPPEQHSLWRLMKRDHTVDACVRATPAGPELRILLDHDLIWSQVIRPPTEDALTAAADTKRAEFEAKGWTLPA